jgi:hypothetical protein
MFGPSNNTSGAKIHGMTPRSFAAIAESVDRS